MNIKSAGLLEIFVMASAVLILANSLQPSVCYGGRSVDSVEAHNFTDSLELSYERLVGGTKADSIRYVEYFPKTFVEFNSTFGYFEIGAGSDLGRSDSLYLAPLSDRYEEMVGAFLAINNTTTERVNRIIQLSLYGYWDADAVAMIHEEMWIILKTEPRVAAHRLKTLGSDERESIKRFLLDGPIVKMSRCETIQGLVEVDPDVFNSWYTECIRKHNNPDYFD